MGDSQRRRRSLIAVAVAVLATAALAAGGVFTRGQDRQPVKTRDDGGVHAILCAIRFDLTTPYTYDWSAERALVSEGWLVVLDVERELVRPRQTAEPVLQMGTETLERVNRGELSGHLVAIVPKPIDLESSPAFFGTPDLPERVDGLSRGRELTSARARGIAPFTPEAVALAIDCGGGPVELADQGQLLELAAQWILEYAPDEDRRAFRLLGIPTSR